MKPSGVVDQLLNCLKLVGAPSVVVVASGHNAITIFDAGIEGAPFQAANVLMPSARARRS